MNRLTVLPLVVLFARSFGAIIDPVRVADWTYAGVPGGIPINRTTIFATVTTASTRAEINTAIDNCPSGQVVYFAAGNYTINGTLDLDTNSGITLRGAGPGATNISFTHTGSACIGIDQYNFTGAAAISSGYTKDSTSVVMTATPNAQVAVGNLIRIDQNDDTDIVKTAGSPARRMRFTARVTNVSGNTVTFTPPLPYTFEAGKSPQLAYSSGGPGPSLIGIEDMTINNTGGSDNIIWYVGADRCWVKNVEIIGLVSYGIFIQSSLQCEVRKCNFHGTAGYPSQPDGFAVYLYTENCWALVEDNIFDEVGVGVLQTGSSCNAVLYNYFGKISFNDWPYQTGGINSNHGAHPMFCLWEGNVTEMFQCDGYHGSASHQTLFRNWFHGVAASGAVGNKKMVSLERGSYYINVVGNILGCSWGAGAWSGPGAFNYEMSGQPDYTAQSVIYRLGYPHVGNNATDAVDIDPAWPLIANGDYPDANVAATLYRHGNYDTKNSAQTWDAGNADHVIPASMLYSSKPAYFKSLAWPPFDPAAPTNADTQDIPAGYRYNNNGADPPDSGGVQTLNVTTLRVAP